MSQNEAASQPEWTITYAQFVRLWKHTYPGVLGVVLYAKSVGDNAELVEQLNEGADVLHDLITGEEIRVDGAKLPGQQPDTVRLRAAASVGLPSSLPLKTHNLEGRDLVVSDEGIAFPRPDAIEFFYQNENREIDIDAILAEYVRGAGFPRLPYAPRLSVEPEPPLIGTWRISGTRLLEVANAWPRIVAEGWRQGNDEAPDPDDFDPRVHIAHYMHKLAHEVAAPGVLKLAEQGEFGTQHDEPNSTLFLKNDGIRLVWPTKPELETMFSQWALGMASNPTITHSPSGPGTGGP
jgi:hypothetical protein